ncbi:MAG: hypothetical protein IKB71_00870 [Lentisphaeria bacterium]|nr:hypothetical protein [Lentisphaeria bacterium]
MDFDHKRGVPGKGKTENFGCFMAFSRSSNSPNREFKTKNQSVRPAGIIPKNVPIATLHIGSETDDALYLQKQMLQPSSLCGLRRAKSEKAFMKHGFAV